MYSSSSDEELEKVEMEGGEGEGGEELAMEMTVMKE
jgi:hypothetical protein